MLVHPVSAWAGLPSALADAWPTYEPDQCSAVSEGGWQPWTGIEGFATAFHGLPNQFVDDAGASLGVANLVNLTYLFTEHQDGSIWAQPDAFPTNQRDTPTRRTEASAQSVLSAGGYSQFLGACSVSGADDDIWVFYLKSGSANDKTLYWREADDASGAYGVDIRASRDHSGAAVGSTLTTATACRVGSLLSTAASCSSSWTAPKK